MSVIEDIWEGLQCDIQMRYQLRLNPMDLGTALQDLWCGLPVGYLQTLAEFMLRRVMIKLILNNIHLNNFIFLIHSQ